MIINRNSFWDANFTNFFTGPLSDWWFDANRRFPITTLSVTTLEFVHVFLYMRTTLIYHKTTI